MQATRVSSLFMYRSRRRFRPSAEVLSGRYSKPGTGRGCLPRLFCSRYPHRGSGGHSRLRSYLMLWLLVFPCHGVQIWQQSTLQGQPVFTTSSVQPADDVNDLQRVRTPNSPIVEPLLRAGPQALRTICVYRHQAPEQPTVLISDDRAHGQLLQRMVCSAFGLADSEWCLHRLVEALPSLPPEQYVLTPALLQWDHVLVPVDLRPLGGVVRLQLAQRCMSCGEVADRAIATQQLGPCPVTLCRTSQGWFHPNSRLLLLPYGDAFQVWPMHQVPQASLSGAIDGEDRPVTLEDRFSTSLSLPTIGELAFHDLSGANAVILHPHGHTYTCLPAYADHLTLRSAALGAVAADLQIRPQGRLCFARLLPPLSCLPAIQYVAAYCAEGEVLGVVDFRPLEGGVHVIQVREGATPAVRIELAVQQYGEPRADRPLAASLAQGRLQVLHREHVVDPYQPLAAAQPAPIVVLTRRSHLAAGYYDPDARGATDVGQSLEGDTLDSPHDVRSGAPPLHVVKIGSLICSLLAVASPRALLLSLSFMLVAAVRESENSGFHNRGAEGRSWQIVQHHPSLASVEEHSTVGRSWSTLDARETLGIAFDLNAGLPEFRFCIWSPADWGCFFLPGSSAPSDLRGRLFESKVALGRHDCVLWDPLPPDRAIHLVATVSDQTLVTVIADTGREYLCLDVPRQRFGASLLSALQALCPDHCYRLSEDIRTPVRNGDVIRVFDDEPAGCSSSQSFVPRFMLAPVLDAGTQLVYIVSADMGTIRLRVPTGVESGDLERALVVWLGRQRCLGTRLLKLDLDVSVPVYCLPRRGRSTLAVGLIDLADTVMDTIVHVTDSAENVVLDCEVLREPWRPGSVFWNDILARDPVCVSCWQASSGAFSSGAPVNVVTLGLDICRALGAGWRPPAPSSVPDYDLVIAAEHLGIQWRQDSTAFTRHAATQTSAAFWPMRASPLFSSALPVPRRADGCSFDERHGSEGTLFHLECPHMQVRCTIPCVAGRHIWALRIGNWVRAACTVGLSWDEVLDVADLSYWDLPGTSIHGAQQFWMWPDDVSSLSGQCGHVMHSGSDPYLECLYAPDPRQAHAEVPSSPSHGRATRWWPSAAIALLSSRDLSSVWVGVSVLLLPIVLAVSDAGSSDTPSALHSSSPSEGLLAMENSTPSCPAAWCHELSCQCTHFTVTPAYLADHFASHSPQELVRVQLWSPFQGPSLFDFQRTDSADALHSKLLAAGHDPLRRVLYIAFDTQSTVVDVVSVPPASGRWWIVRDGISRELLRPVTTWVEESRRAVVTLNSHGQATSLASTPEVASLYNLPQGARGVTAAPLNRVYGYLTAAGLVLMETSIGSVSGASPRAWSLLGLVLAAVPCHAMMQGQVVPARTQAHWGAQQEAPRQTRIWTHTLAAPVVVPYTNEPNPARLAAAVAATQRGVRGDGVFDWAVPRHYGDAAHIIHYPSGLCPPFVFWLLHYRGRGSVICATAGNVDWQYLAQEAHEAFLSPSFLQGAFGIQHNSRVFAYGSDLVAPPHGTILHLVRTRNRASSGSQATVWDSPAELPWIPQFEYNLCLGPRHEAPIQDGRPGPLTAPPASDELHASLAYMQHLLGGLEQSIDKCQSVATALESRSAPSNSEHANGGVTRDAESSTNACRGRPVLHHAVLLALVGLSGVSHRGIFMYGMVVMTPACILADDSDNDEPDGPTEPSSPDLTDLQAPTPSGNIENGIDPRVGVVQRPSDSSLARTSAPLRGDYEPPIPVFDHGRIPQLQRSVAACLGEVDIEHPATPFVPAGCPFTIHNPFTSRSQCKVMSEAIPSPQALRTVFSDFSARRGWQPLVSLHPQPDQASVHLIPAAADPNLASVVLRSESSLQALCLTRVWQGNPYRRITLHGRQGRLREPYSVSRGVGGTVTFRDGDCLHADMGPFGPPPPTPATSFGLRCHPALWCLVALGSLSLRQGTLLVLLGLVGWGSSVHILPPAPEGVPVTKISVSHFPWRETHERRKLSGVCRDRCCRISLLCPWRGPQGLYQTPSQVVLRDVWDHYAEPGRPHELMPVWPSLSADRLWFVPRAHVAGALVCLVAHSSLGSRALVVPARLSVARLLQTVGYMTGWDVSRLDLPPGIFSSPHAQPESTCLLRDGDVLDVSLGDADAGQYLISNPADLKNNVMWTRRIILKVPTFVRIWSPRLRPPILVCIPAGESWDPAESTVSGDFRISHPGRWVPARWTPCRLPHFVQVSNETECANVLFEDNGGVVCVTLDRQVTPFDIMHGTADSCRGVRVLGNFHIGAHAPLELRDGDVVVTGPLAHADDAAWPDLRNAASPRSLSGALLWLSCLGMTSRFGCLLSMLLAPAFGATRSGSTPLHGRSRSPHREDLSRCPSPRIGYWRPDRRHQMSMVATRSECHMQVLCPFRGWGPVPYTRALESQQLMQVVYRDSGTWAVGTLPLGSSHIVHFTVILPLPPAPLVTVLLHTAGTSRAVLLPSCITLRQISAYFVSLAHAPGMRVLVPPALKRIGGYEDETVRLRHGDTFELEADPWHPHCRHHEAAVIPELQHLPHLNVWHMPFVVHLGGWVSIWGTNEDGTSCHSRHWVPDGALWSPRWLHFSIDGRPLSEGRWVPAAYLPDHHVSFVEQPDPQAVHVLLSQPYDSTATACRRLLLDPAAERTAMNRLSEEWQLRPDLQARVVVQWPRNGDIMVPRVLWRAFHYSMLATNIASLLRRPCWGILGLLSLIPLAEGVGVPLSPATDPFSGGHTTFVHEALPAVAGAILGIRCSPVILLLLPVAEAMVVPPAEQQQSPPVPIGKHPWRVPQQLRLCGESVEHCSRARLLSPFCGEGDEVEVSPDTPFEDLQISLSSAEPYWFDELMPIWPAIWPHTAVYMPIPSGRDLVCVAAVSPEWQLAVLTPRRTDLEWLLAYLRRITPGPVLSVHPPVAARPKDALECNAIDWRTGDVVLAFQCGGTAATYELPVFYSPAHVRYTALWGHDFLVQCELTLLIWRVGRPPSETVMPPPARWLSSAQTFTGRFGVKFPGCWVPVPWAHTDKVALCQVAESPGHCNIIYETCQDMRLRGECVTVSSSSSRYSLSQLFDVPPASLSLLGQGVDSAELPPLRDGDTVFRLIEDVPNKASGRFSSPIAALVGCRLSRRACPIVLVGVWWRCIIGSIMPDPPRAGSADYLPDKARQMTQTSVFHAISPRPVDPNRGMLFCCLARLSHYLAALGAPNWARQDNMWLCDLASVCDLQARLHRLWWSRPLRDSLPVTFPRSYHAAWGSLPKWNAGVPSALLISTDGSGLNGGSWAFVVWAYFGSTWYRLGWDAMALPATPWLTASEQSPYNHTSYLSELTALQAAAIWCASTLDQWQLWMHASPASVTVVVDNSAAMQVAAGHAAANQASAKMTRVLWQAVQSRVSTTFRHVHSHVGIMVNTLADGLASLRLPCPLVLRDTSFPPSELGSLLCDLGPYLWLIPRARLIAGRPCLCFSGDTSELREVAASKISAPEAAPVPSAPLEATANSETSCTSVPQSPVSLNVLTANVQTMKDVKPSIFNPSGHAARRQYLLHQVSAIPCDILCIQEARSCPGRWGTGGWLSWRSGHQKGQYGCEVWIRPSIVSPPLTLQSWRILHSSPRIMMVTCTDSRLPVTVCSAHAPHADRPDSEARDFWSELKLAALRAPAYKGLLFGIDANADFFASDDEEHLIGPLLAAGEPDRNDMHLLEFCIHLGLAAPSTHSEVQVGPGWSWVHTGGTRKRLDHILFKVGPWEVQSTSQALDLDLAHPTQDHVPLCATATLYAPHAPRRNPAARRCTAAELLAIGNDFWQLLRSKISPVSSPAHCVQLLTRQYENIAKGLPARVPFVPRQPYLSAATVVALRDLRDWRHQVRAVSRSHELCCLQASFAAWKCGAVRISHVAERRDSRRLLAVMQGQERRLARRVHDLARRDKATHFLSLTKAATDLWHSDGRPMEALTKLRWASRKAAEKRAVFAAGGYDIDTQLEEQFRAQEGGRCVTPQQIAQEFANWVACPAPACPVALPTLLELEHLCRRQQAAKAPGPDLVLNELWRAFPACAGQWFWQVCTQIALTGHEPFHFKLALICALYKKGPAALPQNYRSIALLNGMAKVWHSHLRSSVGQSVLRGYSPFQLGGRRGIPVGFAVAAYRCASELSHADGRSLAVLFIDIQAAYYEASRRLVFSGDDLAEPEDGLCREHLAPLALELLRTGALEVLGMPVEERHLLQDCVECSHWRLVTSERTYAATRGSRPGDGLADVIFGALFSVALRHIRRVCAAEGLAHHSIGTALGADGEVLQLGWADDLAIMADFDTPSALQHDFPRLASIAIATLQAIKFRVNLGAGKTEAILDIRGPQAKRVRGEMLSGGSTLALTGALTLRLAPEYRYLGVVQTPHDTGRRDTELCARRACSAWAHGRSLLASSFLPWVLKTSWMSGRILPAAYATLATSIAKSARAWSPLTGFYERAARTLIGSWQFGHFLTGPLLGAVLGLPTPGHAATIARVRLVVQLVTVAPAELFDLFDAAWNRTTPWCELLADSLKTVSVALPPDASRDFVASIAHVRKHAHLLRKSCRRLSRWGSQLHAVWELWHDILLPRQKLVLGEPEVLSCPLCRQPLPSQHALAAHLHRKHAVVNVMTRYTNGTACLWCHTEHHSTDRLKYHLRRCASCMHGLRVVVGQVYSYGTGTKRTGARQHRGLPPTRLPGPLNATAAQRRAALEGRQCTPQELQHELVQVTGATDVYSWPPLLPEPDGERVPESNRPASPSILPAEVLPASPALVSVPENARWYSLVDRSTVGARDWHTPSPCWERLLAQPFVLQWPATWHRYWRIWQAMHTLSPWSPSAFRAAHVLRSVASAHGASGDSLSGPPSGLLDFLAATIAVRQSCGALSSRGCIWISGVPSPAGRTLLRSLLSASGFFSCASILPFSCFCCCACVLPPACLALGVELLARRPFCCRVSSCGAASFVVGLPDSVAGLMLAPLVFRFTCQASYSTRLFFWLHDRRAGFPYRV